MGELKLWAMLIMACLLNSCVHNEDEWTLSFSDEFNEPTVNFETWSPFFSWGQHLSNSEEVLFIEDAFEIQEGILKIKCEKKDTLGNVYDENWNVVKKEFGYTSGHLYSRNSFSQLYGKFEIRAKTAFGKGFNSAFWMMAYSGWPPEIDIFEVLGKDPNLLRTTNHYVKKDGSHGQSGRSILTKDLSNSFNVYSVEWSPNEIVWFFNGEKVFKSNVGVPNEPMYILISHALGSDFSGYISNNTPLPAYFEIDYVRVYKKTNQ